MTERQSSSVKHLKNKSKGDTKTNMWTPPSASSDWAAEPKRTMFCQNIWTPTTTAGNKLTCCPIVNLWTSSSP